MMLKRLWLITGICLVSILQHSCWEGFKSEAATYVRPLEVVKLSEKNFLHVSYLADGKGGYIPCNGFFRKEGDEVFVFDTPLNDSISKQLINYIQKDLKSEIKGVMVSHSHIDGAGGIGAFIESDIPTYGSLKTAQLLAKDSVLLSHPFVLSDSLLLGNGQIEMRYFGAGHTDDSSVAYLENGNVLLGGCLIKSIDASKGNLNDATVSDWSHTVEKIKTAYPNVQLIIPGHGLRGGQELLDYTIELFDQNLAPDKITNSL